MQNAPIQTTPTPTPATPATQAPTFFGLGIAPKLLDILQAAKYTTPTPIQHQAIPIGVEGKDVIGIAQTGTGKTLAFAIPMLQRLAANKGKGLVLLPTRELALQVDETLQKLGRPLGLRTAVLIGGASMSRQIDSIQRKPHIIVATPGRLNDHIEQRTVSLKETTILVLDEADRMLDMGFAPQINRILATVPKERQTMLFSATMPAEITRIVNQYMKIPVRIEVVPPGTTAERIEQEIYFVHKLDKSRLLEKLLGQYKGAILVFSRTKFGARKLARQVKLMGHSSADIHSDRSLAQRRDALEGFKTGKYRVLIATDIAARGIDVSGIEVVINYDLPDQSDDYVHRIGRTARAGRTGKAISFAMPDQKPDVKSIERLVRMQIPVMPLPADLPPSRAMPHIEDTPRQGYGGGRSFGGGQRREGGRSQGGFGGQRRSSHESRSAQGSQSTHSAPHAVSTLSIAGSTPMPSHVRRTDGPPAHARKDGPPAHARKDGPSRGKKRFAPKVDVQQDQFAGPRPKRGKRKFYGGMGI